MNAHCCKDMNTFIEDPRDPIFYCPILREYYIKPTEKNNIITLAYCPWCGVKLVSSLRDNFFDILDDEFNIEVGIFEVREDPNLPQEFQTDEWWKKRGL